MSELALVSDDSAFFDTNIILNHYAAANGAGAHFRTGADIAAVPHNGLFDLGAFGNNDIVTEDGIGSDHGTAEDAGILSDVNRRNQDGIRADFGPIPDINS